jgi:hypothetical protein
MAATIETPVERTRLRAVVSAFRGLSTLDRRSIGA